MLNRIFKNYQLFISYKNVISNIERFYPVISLKKNMQEDLELDSDKIKVVSKKSPKQGINIIFEGEIYNLEYGKMLSLNGKYGTLTFRIINDWTFNTNFNFAKFFYYSIAFHFLVIMAITLPQLLKADIPKPNNNKETEKRVAEMLEKIEAKEPKKIKIEKPKKEIKKIIVQKKEKKKGFWPSKNPVKNKARKKISRRTRRRASKKVSNNLAPRHVTNKNVSKSLNFLNSGTSTNNIAINTRTRSNNKQRGSRGFGSKGIAVKGITSDRSALKGNGNYSGAIETKGVRGVKSAKYNGRGTGYNKTLNSIEGKVSVRTLGNSNKGKIGGSLRRIGSLRLTGRGKISESKIKKAINKKLYRLTYCYEKALLRKPNLAGIIKIKWTIKTNRRVKNTRIVSSQMKDSKLQKCLMKEIRKIKFPAPRGGEATVIYPFKFKPTL